MNHVRHHPGSPGIQLQIQRQPDDETCGPTCLHSVYDYYGHALSLEQVIEEVPRLEGGGTLAVILANHALSLGFKATIYTYNLVVFDPTWFKDPTTDISAKLRDQIADKSDRKLRRATEEYLRFLELGGEIRYEDLTADLLCRFLNDKKPILTGLSATYLYGCAREYGSDYDDVRGKATGHFVVLCSYDDSDHTVLVADPLLPNPVSPTQYYAVSINRAASAILLGILTYDANLLILEPKG